MSDNNYIRISKIYDEYLIEEFFADNCDNPLIHSHRESTLEKACKYAKKYMQDKIVEFGVRFGKL